MKTSTEIASICKHMSHQKAVESVAKAGFDAYDLSMFEMGKFDWATRSVIENGSPFRSSEYLKFVRELKQVGIDNGIVCNQSHAPFPTTSPEIRELAKRAIECTAEAGGEYCVIHPSNNASPEENAEMFFELLPFAKQYGVKIATENMWNRNKETRVVCPAACSSPEDFIKHLEAVNDPYLVACLDIGHAEMQGLNTSAVEMIEKLGSKYLKVLHVHDNDKLGDNHQIPFSMKIDFPSIVKALKKIDYCGYMTLEADRYLDTVDDIQAGIREMARVARKLAEMYDEA